MTIKLRASSEALVKERLKQGGYESPDDVVETALTFLYASESADSRNTARLRRQIQLGIEQLDRGESVNFTAKDIMREGRKILAARKRAAK